VSATPSGAPPRTRVELGCGGLIEFRTGMIVPRRTRPHLLGGLVFSVCCSHGPAGLCGGTESGNAWL
jgi:hypothetical protein